MGHLASPALGGLLRAGAVAACLGWAIAPLPAQRPTSSEANDSLGAMRLYLARPVRGHQYSAARRLEASGSGHRAWLDVQTDFSPADGLAYRVTAEGGSGYIRNRVLRTLLEEERALIAAGRTATVAISPDNYAFTPEGLTDDGLAVVQMRPLRKDRSLIQGRMFLTLDGELRRVEGQLAKNPSFWVTRVQVVRHYQPINGVLMPVSLETKAQLRWLGASVLVMTYQYSTVDHHSVQVDGDHR